MVRRIKQIREHFGLTQEQFAKKINRTTGFISNVETGRCGISLETIKTICTVFDVNEEWISNGTGKMFLPGKEKSKADFDNICKRIKLIRKEMGLTQEEFGRRIGFTKNYIYFVENGKNIPSEAFINKVSSVFGVSDIWLKTGEGEMRAVDPVDDRLIEWLRSHPEVAWELRSKYGLD